MPVKEVTDTAELVDATVIWAARMGMPRKRELFSALDGMLVMFDIVPVFEFVAEQRNGYLVIGTFRPDDPSAKENARMATWLDQWLGKHQDEYLTAMQQTIEAARS